jgi:two-component system alkaline phosphatase synthesis response regulator PhoP
MSENAKILLVDDEEDILALLKYNLEKEGFTVDTALNGKEGITKAKEMQPDLVVLDVMMPVMDGMEACVEMREIPSLKDIFIVFLTARGEDYSQIAGYDSGADDYITKPIKPRVLVSKIKALLRRKGSIDENVTDEHSDIISIDKEKYLVTCRGENLTLPKKEFELLSLLLSTPGKVFTRETILSSVWGQEIVVGDRTIDVHIRKLREKIGDDLIKTVKGVGYKMDLN